MGITKTKATLLQVLEHENNKAFQAYKTVEFTNYDLAMFIYYFVFGLRSNYECRCLRSEQFSRRTLTETIRFVSF